MKLLERYLPLYGRLLGYVRPYAGRLLAGIGFGTLYGVSNGALLYVVKTIWARVFEQAASALGWLPLLGLAAVLPLVMLGRGVCDFLSAYLMNWVGLRVVMELRARLFEHLQELSLDFFTETNTGEMISRVTNDVGLVQQSISNVIEDIIKQPVSLVVVVGYLFYTDWRLSAAAFVLFPLCLVPVIVFGRRTRRASRAAQEHQASLVGVLHEALAGYRVVKAFGMEQREARDFRALCQAVFRQRMRVIRSRAMAGPIIELVAAVGAALVFVYAYRAGLQASQLIAIAMGLFLMYEPVKRLTRVHLQVQESLSAAERVFALLDQKPSVVEKPGARALPRFGRAIEFENVSFRYELAGGGRDSSVLEEINLTIPAGSLVAVVGASGAGKTTLMNLIPRFYDPSSGAVKIDGVDIREVTLKSLRDQIGLVTQETFLFNDTVANNIAYGKPGASMAEIVHAARRAHAHEFILQMPQQYDTVIGESGVKLSGGQRQRLAIARAILKDPPILLLDEATSALDTESERAVQAALDELMWGEKSRRHTMLVIAHRLSTVQHADQIVVLERGRIVERGTHEELLRCGGVYRRLYEMQFGV